MNRQQFIGGAAIVAVLIGVWVSSRDPSAPPQAEFQALPKAAAALITATASASPIPSPTLVVLTFEPEPTETVVFVVEAPPAAAAQFEAQAQAPAAPPATEAAPAPPTAAAPPPAPADDPSVAGAEQSLVDNANYQRAQYGLPPYARDETLMLIARGRAADMAARNYFSHFDPLTGAGVARDQMAAAGYARSGENIFRSRGGLAELGANAVGWFMTDQVHRDNILHPVYTAIGAGVALQGEAWVVVLCFAN